MAVLGGQLLSITVSLDYGQALAALIRVRQLWLRRLHHTPLAHCSPLI